MRVVENGKDGAETKEVGAFYGQRGSESGEGDGGAHRRQSVALARGNARGFPEGLGVLYQQSAAIYHLWRCVRVCVGER